NAASSDTRGSAAGKKFAARIGAKNPYTAKSYHSSTLPITPAVTTRRSVHGVALVALASIPVTAPMGRECTCSLVRAEEKRREAYRRQADQSVVGVLRTECLGRQGAKLLE